MKDYLAERKLIVIAIVAIVGFLVFAVVRRPAADTATSNGFTTVNMGSPMTKGNAGAKVSIIQYSDFICPSCSYFSTEIMPTIDKEFVETGKANFEFRPMAFIADGSTQGGAGAYCAVEQKKFWQYHDAVYKVVYKKVFDQGLDPKSDIILTVDNVKQIAGEAGLDSTAFTTCMDSKKHLEDIASSTTTAQRNGVTGTPYILVNGQAYKGDISLDAFRAFIKALL